jgi:hypothetical protein
MSRRNPFHDPIDPFRDPTNPFLDPSTYGPGGQNMASAAGSNAELISLEALREVPSPVMMVRIVTCPDEHGFVNRFT